jgi:hypothetical protein
MAIKNGVGMVSPTYPAGKLYTNRTEDRIDVYEDRWRGWFFAPARRLLDDPDRDNDMAALLLTVAYFENYWIFKTGESSNGHSPEFFNTAFVEVFLRESGRTRPTSMFLSAFMRPSLGFCTGNCAADYFTRPARRPMSG